MDIKATVARLKELRTYLAEIPSDCEGYRQLEGDNGYVQAVMDEAQERAGYTLRLILTPWNLLRIRIGRPSNHVLDRMARLGSTYHRLGNEVGVTFKYPGSQAQRESDPEMFRKRERIYANMRDNLYTLIELNEISYSLREYFTASEHILSERGFKWVNIGIGFVLGAFSTILGSYFLKILGLT